MVGMVAFSCFIENKDGKGIVFMKRILHILYNNMVKQGGIESFLIEIYRNIDKNKVQFDFLSLESSDDETYEQEIVDMGGKMYILNIDRSHIFSVRRSLCEFLELHTEYDIVHIHVSSLYYIEDIISVSKSRVKKCIVHAHNSKQLGPKVLSIFHYFNRNRIEKFATDFFACSSMAAEFMFPKSICTGGRYKVIKNGINVNAFKYSMEKRNAIRSEFGFKDEFVVGMVGRIAPQKNQMFLVDVFDEVQKINPNSKLLIVGDGPSTLQVKKKVEKLGLNRDVIFTGVRMDIPNILCGIDVYVHPALFEGLGITIIEAQASGLPCVVSAEKIPEEAHIIDEYRVISLKNSAKKWAEEICNIKNKHDRCEYTSVILQAGYDSKDVASELEKIYLE